MDEARQEVKQIDEAEALDLCQSFLEALDKEVKRLQRRKEEYLKKHNICSHCLKAYGTNAIHGLPICDDCELKYAKGMGNTGW